jgi:chromosome segregation ATPase
VADDLEARLAATAAALREREIVDRRCEDLRERIVGMDGYLAWLRAQHAEELTDVARLEGLSLARVLTSLSGARDDRLARERAEAQAAALRLQDAEGRLVALWREHDAAEIRRRALAWAPAAHIELLDEKEQHLRSAGDPRLPRICELAEERGRLAGELHELGEALHAAATARRAIVRAQDHLERAHRWMGFQSQTSFTSYRNPMSINLLNDAAAAAAEADRCVIVLRTELADVDGVGLAAPHLAVDGLARCAAPGSRTSPRSSRTRPSAPGWSQPTGASPPASRRSST